MDPIPESVKLLVPAYVYPSPSSKYWSSLLCHKQVACVIINPDNGIPPCSKQDKNFARIVSECKQKGIKAVGYVFSDYARRNVARLKQEINRYFEWYAVDGIFVDEVSTNQSDVLYFCELYNYVKGISQSSLVVLNPGTWTDASYIEASDILVTFESCYGEYVGGFNPKNWEREYPNDRFCHLIYQVRTVAQYNKALAKATQSAGWIYLTDKTLPNPWNALPSYWSAIN